MALKEREFTLRWENGNFFELTEKPGGEDVIIVIRVEENGDFARQKANIRGIALDCLRRRLDTALDEMTG